MNTPTRTQRLAAALASAVLTLALFSTIASQAQPPVAGSMFAQTTGTRVA